MRHSQQQMKSTSAWHTCKNRDCVRTITWHFVPNLREHQQQQMQRPLNNAVGHLPFKLFFDSSTVMAFTASDTVCPTLYVCALGLYDHVILQLQACFSLIDTGLILTAKMKQFLQKVTALNIHRDMIHRK